MPFSQDFVMAAISPIGVGSENHRKSVYNIKARECFSHKQFFNFSITDIPYGLNLKKLIK